MRGRTRVPRDAGTETHGFWRECLYYARRGGEEGRGEGGRGGGREGRGGGGGGGGGVVVLLFGLLLVVVVFVGFGGSSRRPSPSAFILTLLLLLLLLEIHQMDTTVLGTHYNKEGRLLVGVALEARQLRDGDGLDEAEGTVFVWVVVVKEG